MFGPKNVRSLTHHRPILATFGWTTTALAATACLAAALLLALGLSGLTACSTRPAPPTFVQGGYSPAPASTPRPIGPAPAPEK